MRVALLHPIWDRTCQKCETFQCKSDGTFLLNRRTGEPYLRGRAPTPCYKCEKVPLELRQQGADNAVLRAAAIELTPRNRQCWKFYQRCRATGNFPDDPIVSWAAGLLRPIYDELDRRPLEQLGETLVSVMATLVLKKR